MKEVCQDKWCAGYGLHPYDPDRCPLYRYPMQDPHNAGKARLGWRYWPTVYFWALVNETRAWWRRLGSE